MQQPTIDTGLEETATAPALNIRTLTEGMTKGDEDAYRNFHKAYFPRCYRYLLVVAAGDEDVVREAVQSTFLRVVRYIKPFDEESRFWNWLTVLARTALADQRRKRNRYVALLERFIGHAQAESESAAANDDEADARLLTTLEHYVHSLSPDERELVERKYLIRESVRDIAASLQISEKAVESRLTRVRVKLKTEVLNGLKNEPQD